jgi:hypothetical protein
VFKTPHLRFFGIFLERHLFAFSSWFANLLLVQATEQVNWTYNRTWTIFVDGKTRKFFVNDRTRKISIDDKWLMGLEMFYG